MIVSMEANKRQQGPLGCMRHGHGLVILHLLSIALLAGLLVAVLVQGFKDPSFSGNEKIYKQLNRLGAGVDSLCRPCPWEWTFFNRKCYYVSKSLRNWNDSVTACQEVEAQLVVVENDEEQEFLSVISKDKESAWMGLRRESMWQWVDGTHLSDSFKKHQKEKENDEEEGELCAEVTDSLWTTDKCEHKKFWICEKSEAPCPVRKV